MIFQDCIGVPPIQYLNRVRLKASRAAAHDNPHHPREVSAAVGIENTTHFINLFKDAGITPLQFRQSSCTNLYFSGFYAVLCDHMSLDDTDSPDGTVRPPFS